MTHSSQYSSKTNSEPLGLVKVFSAKAGLPCLWLIAVDEKPLYKHVICVTLSY